MTRPDSLPTWAWNSSVAALAVALLSSILLLVATLLGIADPPHLGKLSIDQSFVDDARSQITASTNVPAQLETLSADITCPCTIELQIQQLSGPADAGYGLWWGPSNQDGRTLLGANSDGYLAILPADPSSAAPLRDWQIFPHVRSLGDPNTFRVDIDPVRLTIRLNDEVAASLDTEHQGNVSAGYFFRASQSGDAVFQLVHFKVWETDPSGD